MSEQSNKTRENILKAAMELFAEKGFHETSMAAIAKRAGLGKGTLYWHFSSKDELFKQLISEKGEGLFRQLRELLNQKFSPEKILKEFIRIKLIFMIENRELSQILLNNMQFTDQEFKLKLFQRHKEMVQELQKIIQRGMDEGIFRRGSSRDTAVAIIGMINSMNSILFFEDEDIDITEKVEFLYRMIMCGIKNE
ncbi:hypothetical protein BBF96_04400 [Anoxybacter fermentans]|uniref:HTH tetR-type domain-containing protein n=1 Tax=Anoxybacter fermentans TaxID=1323375 RepID=A0A3Q9HR40_9FIRM|nr:TetR/AcrR family transcriptional regulator [Anoxybacter fermentans]AZR72697.1 hypothetical protein BBF96_04400 [Anoxybacter fermentans]